MKGDNIYQWIENHKEEIYQHSQALMKMNTFSLNHKGISEALTYVEEEILNKYSHLVTYKRHKKGNSPDLLVVQNKILTNKKGILFSGHIDTVYEHHEQEVERKKDILYGPGAVDMKPGLVVALYTLFAMNELFETKTPMTLIVSPDEEIGSIHHQETRANYYKKVSHAFVYESAGDNYEVVIKRKGVLHVNCSTYGMEGHAGLEKYIWRYRNAIEVLIEFLHKVNAIEDEKKGISVNIGSILGGKRPNIIAGHAEATVDIRAYKARHIVDVRKKLNELSEKYEVKIDYLIDMYPMENNAKKLKQTLLFFEEAAEEVGIEFNIETRGGGSDGNHIAKYVDVIVDGLGPRGKYSHSSREYVIISSIYEQLEYGVRSLDRFLSR